MSDIGCFALHINLDVVGVADVSSEWVFTIVTHCVLRLVLLFTVSKHCVTFSVATQTSVYINTVTYRSNGITSGINNVELVIINLIEFVFYDVMMNCDNHTPNIEAIGINFPSYNFTP